MIRKQDLERKAINHSTLSPPPTEKLKKEKELRKENIEWLTQGAGIRPYLAPDRGGGCFSARSERKPPTSRLPSKEL